MSPTSPSRSAVNPWLRNSAFGGAALGAVILLAVFYAVVSGAVERAASRRADASDRSSAAATTPMSGNQPVQVARLGG